MPSRSLAVALAATLAAAVLLPSAAAQVQAPLHHWEFVTVRSGERDNPTPVEGVVWSTLIAMPAGTPWLRLWFSRVHLDGQSHLRIASLLDGDVQILHKQHLEQWQNSSAFFNGGAVLLELVAGPRTQGNLVEIDKVMAADVNAATPQTDTICGTTDDRVPSSNPAAGRIDTIGCSGWIIDVPAAGNDKLHLSAGHCFAAGQILEFNVPASNANCSLVHPPASSQFAINPASISNNGGLGNDYWVFRCFPNPNTGLTTFQTQGPTFTLAAAIPGVGTTLRNFGYGLDGTNTNNATGDSCSCTANGQRNQTQQTHTGALVSVSGTLLNYTFDTCGGNSGSVVTNDGTGQAVAIHTNAGCTATGGSNSGTAVTNAGLQNAINTLANGPVFPANDECAGALPVVSGQNGPFNNFGATSSAAAWPCGPGSNDVWFRYVATCSGSTTFSTCTANRTIDTVLQVFGGSCQGLVNLGCNDDTGGTCGLGSTLAVNLAAGATCLVRVGGFSGAQGAFDLVVTPCGLANDCTAPVPLALGSNGPFTNVGATTSAPAFACGSGGDDVWFAYLATATVPTTFTTCSALRTVDTVLEVFGGSCASPVSIGCNDDSNGSCGLGSRVTANLTSGQSYLVRVGGFAAATGVFEVTVELGTGTGSIVRQANGCGPTIIATTGAPHIGGTVATTLSSVTGVPFIGMGFSVAPTPFCTCTVGHDWSSATFGPARNLTVPVSAAFIGAVVGIQGADFNGTGGCPSPQITFTDTMVVTIG